MRARAVALVLLLAPAVADAQLRVVARNPLGAARPDETIAVAWPVVAARLPGVRPGRVRVLDAAGREVASQAYDADADGRPDSLLILSAFGPNEARRFTVQASAPTVAYAKRVHVRHDWPRDDVAWENDRVAFRAYGPALTWANPNPLTSSGLDAWSKRTRALILEKWYAPTYGDYHKDRGEGADFFDVGPTLGAGGTAIWRGDSLHRSGSWASWRPIADGPIRAAFELRYAPWDAAGLRVSEVKRIVIDAGQHLYRQESTFQAHDSTTRAIPYAIGLVRRPGMTRATDSTNAWAWLSGYGPLTRKNSHGDLGLAVLLPRERAGEWRESAEHFFVTSTATPGTPVVHWLGTGWSAEGSFKDAADWHEHLRAFARRLAAPVVVTLEPAR